MTPTFNRQAPHEYRFKNLLPHQKEFLDCQKKYVVVAAGVKSGKTVAASLFAIEKLLTPGTRGAWVAPTYQQALDPGMKTVLSLLPPELIAASRESFPPSVTLRNGSSLHFRSGDQPDTLYGTVYDFGVIDEAGRVLEASHDAIKSTLAPTAGPIRYISNPCERVAWFYRQYVRGLDPDDPDVKSFKWRTADNTMVPALLEYVDEIRRNEPEWKYRAMCLGEFFDTTGMIFRGIRECATGALRPPERGRVYRAGADLARLVDYVVVTVVDELTGAVCSWERWHRTSWKETCRRIAATARRYNGARVVVDQGGCGDMPVEELSRLGVFISPVRFSAASKADMIEHLGSLLEKGLISFPPLDVLIGELESFRGEASPSGITRYSAPPGAHDDAVVSLGLAVWGLNFGTSSGADFLPWGGVGAVFALPSGTLGPGDALPLRNPFDPENDCGG